MGNRWARTAWKLKYSDIWCSSFSRPVERDPWMRGGCGELVIRDCLVRRATHCKVGTQEKMLTGTTYLERFDDA